MFLFWILRFRFIITNMNDRTIKQIKINKEKEKG